MNQLRAWSIVVIAVTLAVGCFASEDSIRIVSISPNVDSPLQVGDRVTFKVEVEYHLASAELGSITLVIQQGESGRVPLANETQVVQKGGGQLVLSKIIEVPDTSAIQVFTPITVQGSHSTRIVDTRIYKVVKKVAAGRG